MYSKYLLRLVNELRLPTKLTKSGFGYGEISSRHLLAILIFNRDLYQSRLDSVETDEFDLLHMHHLIRFLKKDYEDTITEYERMKKAGVTSLKMLWTLMVPDVEVVYYCDVSKEELCGKVVVARYNISDSDYFLFEHVRKQVDFMVRWKHMTTIA